MTERPPGGAEADATRLVRPDFAYALSLFVTAAFLLAFAIRDHGVLPDHGWGVAILFLVFGLITIAMGYPHPNFGYVSFDRVSQVASILVLGPVDAAWINGLASLLYPWHRLRKGLPVREVIVASMNNAGLMTLVIFLCGSLYTVLGGQVPLTGITPASVALLFVLVVTMQALNDLSMFVLLFLSRGDPSKFFNGFATALELSSAAVAVLVAIIYNRMETSVFLLLLAVLSLGMLALRQFARMRNRLEALVEERTRSLQEKTLELERQATQDKLTSLYNRRYADAFLERELETARRHAQELTVALADIDFFKQINDLYSHATGDAVLKRVAEIFHARCRRTDMIARYGGEEFLLCFPQTDRAQARQLCEELRAAVEAEDWSQLGLAETVTISFGLAGIQLDSSRQSILSAADHRLYDAKHGGRNLVVA